jgi:hypothetical protein
MIPVVTAVYCLLIELLPYTVSIQTELNGKTAAVVTTDVLRLIHPFLSMSSLFTLSQPGMSFNKGKKFWQLSSTVVSRFFQLSSTVATIVLSLVCIS